MRIFCFFYADVVSARLSRSDWHLLRGYSDFRFVSYLLFFGYFPYINDGLKQLALSRSMVGPLNGR